MKRPERKSILGIWISTSKHRKTNCSNYLWAVLLGVIAFAIEFNLSVSSGKINREIISMLLTLNGSILGLVIAGFSFSNAIPSKLMAFFSSTQADDYPWSNYKQILLNYFYCYVSLFFGITFLILMYLFSYIDIEGINCLSGKMKQFIKTSQFSFVWLIQGFVLTELKIFLFWIYENSILLGAAVAIEDKKIPFDDGNA